MRLEQKDIDKFESDGYLVVKNIIPVKQIQALRDAFEIIREKSKNAGNVNYDRNYPEASFILGDLTSFSELKPFNFLVFNTNYYCCCVIPGNTRLRWYSNIKKYNNIYNLIINLVGALCLCVCFFAFRLFCCSLGGWYIYCTKHRRRVPCLRTYAAERCKE